MNKEKLEAVECAIASIELEGLEVSESCKSEMMKFANEEIELSDVIDGLNKKYGIRD